MRPALRPAYPDIMRIDLGAARNQQFRRIFCRGKVRKSEILASWVIVPVSLYKKTAAVFQRVGGLIRSGRAEQPIAGGPGVSAIDATTIGINI
jgi:hypothetical protein